MNKSLTITLNGKSCQVQSGTSLAELITSFAQSQTALATAVNQIFVPRTERAQRLLTEGDAVSTFQPITGG